MFAGAGRRMKTEGKVLGVVEHGVGGRTAPAAPPVGGRPHARGRAGPLTGRSSG